MYPSKMCQLLLESLNPRLTLGIPLGVGHHNANPPHSILLLGTRRQRPRS